MKKRKIIFTILIITALNATALITHKKKQNNTLPLTTDTGSKISTIKNSNVKILKENPMPNTKIEKQENLTSIAKVDTKIDTNEVWNLSDIYPNWEAWEADVIIMKQIMKEIPLYKGKIGESPETFIQFTERSEKLSRLVDKIYLYPYLMKDLDSKNQVASEKLQEIEGLYTKFGTETAFITPEILKIPKDKIMEWVSLHPILKSQKFSLNELYRLQAHVLDEKSEKLLSYFSQFNTSVNDIYQELSTSDIAFNTININGVDTEITNGAYSKITATDRNQENRKKAFEALYNSYNINKNTYAAIYRGILQRSVASSKAKNYNSTLEKSLEPKNISPEIYLTLLASAKANNAPLQRYINLRKKYLGLAEYHYYDNQINIVEYNRDFPYNTSKDLVINSVKPLGAEYQENLKTALSNGWLDVSEKSNKRSGAYSINIFDVHPYMLLNYNNTMNAAYTLAHELGHTVHSMYSTKYQPYATSNYTIFVAEVASTFNERLLLDHMLSVSTDSKEKIALIEQSLGNILGTFYMQTLFADYEYQAHKLVENNIPVTPEALDGIMSKLFKEYYGDTVATDELQKIIWARIPHFFNSPYYVYQYATSFAASATLYDKITNTKYTPEERALSLEKYLTLLKSGGNDQPMNQLSKAGVDLTHKDSFSGISIEFNRLLDLLEIELEKEFPSKPSN